MAPYAAVLPLLLAAASPAPPRQLPNGSFTEDLNGRAPIEEPEAFRKAVFECLGVAR
jgi:hypothetical protein